METQYIWSNDIGCWIGSIPPGYTVNDYPKEDILEVVSSKPGDLTTYDEVVYRLKK